MVYWDIFRFCSLQYCRGGVIECGRLMIFLGAGEMRGFAKENPGSSNIKAALQISL